MKYLLILLITCSCATSYRAEWFNKKSNNCIIKTREFKTYNEAKSFVDFMNSTDSLNFYYVKFTK
jgi:hypothetical protein